VTTVWEEEVKLGGRICKRGRF